ncbi:hypothetical protein A2U01_0050187, partial [Trifolium medium]|nr:hypothetical protein [Trifolium medium]
MQILESQFGHPHVMKRNAFAASDHPDLFRGSSSQSQEPPSNTINVVATDGDEFDD